MSTGPAASGDSTRSDSPLVPRASRLTRLYILALSAVALLSFAGQLLVQQSLQRQWSDSTVVNLAGRQRMLSQKLTKAALVWQRTTDKGQRAHSRSEIRTTLELWKRTHHGLQNGDRELRLPGALSATVAEQFAKLQPTFTAMVGAAESLLVDHAPANADEAIARLLELEPQFLQGMNAVVFQLDAEAHDRVATLRSIEWVLFALTLIVLVVEGALVFRPAVQGIREAATELMRSREELRAAKEAAESANEQKSRFLATISHELRNPLHAMLGSAELAAKLVTNEEQRVLLETITASGQSLRSLVEDLLDLACIQAGKLRVQAAPFDLCAVAQQSLAMLRPMAERGGLELRGKLPSEALFVLGDRLRVQQIMLNLLGNAIKFTEFGSVSLNVSHTTDRGVLMEVIDTGPGIRTEQQAKIFAAFERGDHAFEREQTGIGLGLAVCKGLVDLMHGQIKLQSQPGCGTRFRVNLPLVRVAKTTSASTAGLPLPSSTANSYRILVAEDDPVNRKLLADFLRTLGHETVLTESGEAALRLLQREQFDVALIDGNMPGLDGWEVARRIRASEAENKQLPRPLIAITAAGSVEANPGTGNRGFNLTLIKPVSLDQLRAALDCLAIPTASWPATQATFESRWSNSLARMQGKQELFAAVAQALIAALPEELEALERLTAKRDFVQLARTAHLLKGQMAAFDEESLVSAASDLEVAAEAHDLQACEELRVELAKNAVEFAHLLRIAIAGNTTSRVQH